MNLCELTQDEIDLGSDWPRTGSSGTTPAGKSASSSSGHTGTAGGSSKQAGTSHQSGQTRDAQPNAFGTAGNAAATGAPSFLLTLYCCTVQGGAGVWAAANSLCSLSKISQEIKDLDVHCATANSLCCCTEQIKPFLS